MRWVAVAVAAGSPVASHVALALGQGYGAAMALAGLQAVAVGVALWSVPGRLRWAGPVVTLALLAALGSGGLRASGLQPRAEALLAAAGVSHAMLYLGLLAVFGATLRPGQEALVTGFARRLNPGFHAGMVGYTRGVTWAWCGFFAGQVLASSMLLAWAPALWPALVTTMHVPMVAAMAAAEFLLRRWRWRGGHYTGLVATVRGVSAIARGARTSSPAPGCPGRSGSATPRRPPA